MRFKKYFSKSAKKEFAIKMSNIDDFCKKNNIHASLTNDSYYFTINNKNYRVSNHTMKTSNKHAFNDFGEQIRPLYHNENDFENLIEITAGKTRIIEIYEALKAGKTLNKRGFVVEENDAKNVK